MKKIPKDIKLLVDKGNFVIAIKELSNKENISFEEAKQRIDAYEESQNQSNTKRTEKTFRKSTKVHNPTTENELQNNDLKNLATLAKNDIDAQKKLPIRYAWIRLIIILTVALGLAILAYQVL